MKKKRVKYAVRKEYVERFLVSGLSMAQFCKKEKLNYKTFYNWIKSVREEKRIEKSSPFVPVHLTTNPVSTPSSKKTTNPDHMPSVWGQLQTPAGSSFLFFEPLQAETILNLLKELQ